MLGAILNQALQDEESFDEFTMLGGVEWRPRDAALLYYTYSEGFKAGVGLLGQFETGIAEPETVQSHEIGVKSEWLAGRLVANAAVSITTCRTCSSDARCRTRRAVSSTASKMRPA